MERGNRGEFFEEEEMDARVKQMFGSSARYATAITSARDSTVCDRPENRADPR
jgi:hypothetical protein